MNLRIVDPITEKTISLRLVDNGDGTYSLPVSGSFTAIVGGGIPAAGKKNVDATGPVALATNQACRKVFVQNDPDSADDVLIGTATTQSIHLRPTGSFTLEIDNVNLLYAVCVNSGGTATVNWLANHS